MGHLKETEMKFINIFFPHVGSNKGRKRDKHKIYIINISEINCFTTHPPLSPSPVWQTNPAYGKILIFKHRFADFPWFIEDVKNS